MFKIGKYALALTTAAIIFFAPSAQADRLVTMREYMGMTYEERYSVIENVVVIRGNECFSRVSNKRVQCRHVCDWEFMAYARHWEYATKLLQEANIRFNPEGYISNSDWWEWTEWLEQQQWQTTRALDFGTPSTCPQIRVDQIHKLTPLHEFLEEKKN